MDYINDLDDNMLKTKTVRERDIAKEFIIVFAVKPTQLHIKRFSLEELLLYQIKVIILDMGELLMPIEYELTPDNPICDTRFECVKIENRKDADDYFSMHNYSLFFLQFSDYYEVRYVYKLLTKYNIEYGYLHSAQSDFSIMKIKNKSREKRVISWYYIKNGIYHRYTRKLFKYKPASFMIFGGTLNENYLIERGKCSIKTQRIYIWSLNYENFLLHDIYRKSKKYCVFLDQYLPFHRDMRGKKILNVDSYYSELREIFRKIENIFYVEVIIAAHPSADYRGKEYLFDGFKIEYGITAELVKGAKFVLAQYSNAFSYAIMAMKPILLVKNRSIKQYKEAGKYIDILADYLNIKKIHSSEDIKQSLLAIDNEKYDELRKLIIKGKCEYDEQKFRFWNIFIQEYIGRNN